MSADDELIGDYGVDAPWLVRRVGYAAAAFMGVAVVAAVVDVVWLMVVAFLVSAFVALLALALVRSSRVGKLRERVRLVSRLELEGTERVLDVGCGRGLLLVEAARQLPDGLAVGVDVWRSIDLTENDPQVTLDNAELEDVEDSVEVQTADARQLPFADASFDAVVSSTALHHVASRDGRVQAIREVDRVLRPGGRLIIVDIAKTLEYVHALRACKWLAVRRLRPTWRLLPPVRYVLGIKPTPDELAAARSEWERRAREAAAAGLPAEDVEPPGERALPAAVEVPAPVDAPAAEDQAAPPVRSDDDEVAGGDASDEGDDDGPDEQDADEPDEQDADGPDEQDADGPDEQDADEPDEPPAAEADDESDEPPAAEADDESDEPDEADDEPDEADEDEEQPGVPVV